MMSFAYPTPVCALAILKAMSRPQAVGAER